MLSSKHEKLREEVKRFVEEEIIPRAREIDEKDAVPRELIDKLTKPPLRLTALSIPKKYGGLELDELSICVIAEEVGAGYAAFIPFMEVAELTARVIMMGGSDEQKEEYLKILAEGKTGAYALTDEGPGSDPAAMKTTAVRKNGKWVINGRKRLITFADIAKFFIVFAKTENGISAFVVNTPIKLSKHEECMGLRGHRAYQLEFDNLEVPEKALLGKEGKGLSLALSVLNTTRISLSAGYVGLARAAWEQAVKFAKNRIIGGRAIIEYQAIRFPLTEVATQIDAARLLVWRAAKMCEEGLRHRKETSMAKLFAAETLVKTVDTAIRVMGAYGASKDYPVERFLRDAYTWIHAQGTLEVQKIVISRELFD